MTSMIAHLAAFIFYTFAMLGILFVAFVVYKNVALKTNSSIKTKFKVEDMLKLSPRKTLYVINYNGEKFLIASDIDSTRLLAKIEETVPLVELLSEPEFEQEEDIEEKFRKAKAKGHKGSVMRDVLKELNTRKKF